MSNLKIVSGKGFTKDEAFAKQANYDVKFNATLAWKKANSPVGTEFKAFAADYLGKKLKSVAGIGVFVVVSSGVEDNRERPYTTNVIATEGKRKYKANYIIVDKATEAIVGDAGKKSEAIAKGKDIVSEKRIDVRIELIKRVSEGQAIAAEITYTPSKNAKEGSFMFFGIEPEQ